MQLCILFIDMAA